MSYSTRDILALLALITLAALTIFGDAIIEAILN